MRQEISKSNYDEVSGLAKDIEDNERKINEHGKRAESIVKGMLLHSRTNTGAREPTDINKQADEFLRLAYHGFRAKDKTFNAAITTDYDPSVGSLNVVPQEIGRVLLNLFNNAFYAVNEKQAQQKNGYEPTISVSTKRTSDKVIITVRDNGNGITQKVIDKIFQPFFTTKPTGQGTGLGLSLAYDIVKAHGGEVKVDTVEGEYTSFTLLLPA
jgi:signal transduction histidine kinase